MRRHRLVRMRGLKHGEHSRGTRRLSCHAPAGGKPKRHMHIQIFFLYIYIHNIHTYIYIYTYMYIYIYMTYVYTYRHMHVCMTVNMLAHERLGDLPKCIALPALPQHTAWMWNVRPRTKATLNLDHPM